MLGKGYCELAGIKLPNPTKNGRSYSHIENIKTSEDGHDIGSVTRLNKRTFSWSFNCSSRGYNRLLQIASLAETTLQIYGETIPGRFRLQTDDLQIGSEYCARTDGLFTVQARFFEK